jgi:hypothetical protein
MSSQKLTPEQIREQRREQRALAAAARAHGPVPAARGKPASAMPTPHQLKPTASSAPVPKRYVYVSQGTKGNGYNGLREIGGDGNSALLRKHKKEEAIRLAREKHNDFDSKDLEAKRKIVKELYTQLENQNTKPKAKVLSKTEKKKINKKRVHWQNGQFNGPLATNQQQKTNRMLAAQMARDQQVYDNAKMAVQQQQLEFKQLGEMENEQAAGKLQEQYNREQAQAVANAANAENQQQQLGCRPDGTNTACVLGGMGAGAVAGSVLPVVGTGIGACVGAACGLGAAVKRRFTGQGRKSRKKRGRKHKGKTRKKRKKKTKKRRKKNRKKRTKRRR